MKTGFWCGVLGVAVLLCCASGAFAAGAAVDSETLQLTLPHVEYAGQRYHLVLDFAGDLGDGLYWRFNTIYPTSVAGQCGGSADAGLNISEVCVLLAGGEYKVNLEFRQNPAGNQGLFWKLGNVEVRPCTITHVAGAGMECVDPGQFDQMFQCIMGCGEDISCLNGCLGDLGAFQLSVQFTNSTSSDLNCIIPPGTIFIPEDISVQKMLMVHKDALHVPAGSTETFCITTYCMNSDLHAPDEIDAYVTGGGVTTSCMAEIVRNIYGKNLGTATAEVQTIVWDCSDSGTISEAQRAFLQGL